MTSPLSQEFDLGVIGGGIAGAAVARDAALRGARVVLFEMNTLGSGTSSKSSKLIHGGIRYLELSWRALKTGDFRESWKNLRFVFSALRESRILRRSAPDLVRPLPIWIPVYRSSRRSRFAVYAGAILYGLMAELCGNRHSPKIFFSARGLLKEIPELDPQGLIGGIVIWDHLTDDQALVRAVAASASKAGAQCHEQAEVLSYTYDPAANGHRLRVRLNGSEKAFLCRKVVNASGPWVDEVRERGHELGKKMILPISGTHINVKAFLSHSVLLEAPDGRLFFVIRIGDTARLGTTERTARGPLDAQATDEEIQYLLDAAKRYFPGVSLSRKDILSSDAGIRPLAAPAYEAEANRVSREHEIRVGAHGVIHLLGVKLTDHRRAAEEVMDRLAPSLASFNPAINKRSLTAKTPL